ncbi:MAG: hypothetical protein DMG09_18250 [Acidobacteria bacterium]|nr:MAG: hypothetical protein DMG09_18250 [Acidobacteriota bacterium]
MFMRLKRITWGGWLAFFALLLISFPLRSYDDRSRLGPNTTSLSPGVTQNEAGSPPQSDVPVQDAVIRVDSNLVAVPVSVTDSTGRPVQNLEIGDFALEENGRPQSVARLGEPGETPVDLALLFDISGSTSSRFEFEQQAASKFLKEVLRPKDAVSIFSIGPTPKLVSERTSQVPEAIASLMKIEPTKAQTAFFDSVVAAAQYLERSAARDARRVEVVISDGEDNNSDRYTLVDSLREVQRADCLLYSINPGGPSIRLNNISLKGQEGMEALATHTGGAAFLPEKIEDLTAIFARIGSELQAQYLLGYYSSDSRKDGNFRSIQVRIPKRAGLRVRARQGYYASGSRPSD